ncbi:hypothetical protein LAG90_02465 [Marinilongibacter aquaticus]|uniref:hypothetical protein n=1 Tax=Marinilongibacter aquaticus TaxID=2975157 RepID=UPI0021BD4EF9|nr:hypothetical protein [Marinilongibacter aquaticus]UBM59519.1 hypothetical protein LAG90_02465 [Marinilongibacter aquaticus]
MSEEEEIALFWKQLRALGVFAICAVIFAIFYTRQEKKLTKELEECSFVTIMYPVRMPDSGKVYFYFICKNRKIESSGELGMKVGYWKSKKLVLGGRYWVQISCDDLQTNRVLWDVPVPDTLNYVPPKGWKSIPYGLDKFHKKPFTSFRKYIESF